LIALGVIAEPASLSVDEKRAVLDTVIGAAGGAPVVATVMSLDLPTAAAEIEILTSEFAPSLAAVMIPVVSTDGAIVRRSITDAHRLSGLPVLLQDLPSATGTYIEIDELIAAVRGLGDAVSAVKCEAAPSFWRIRRLRDEVDTTLLSGGGGIGLVDDMLAGADGVAAGISRPEILVEAVASIRAGNFSRAQRVIDSASALINVETQARTSIAIRKEHWRRQGVIESSMVRVPAIPYEPGFDIHSARLGFGNT
jgi:4-hydroxy-tetrahydrodipicolinate synthase